MMHINIKYIINLYEITDNGVLNPFRTSFQVQI
jgi:hypothetical protein